MINLEKLFFFISFQDNFKYLIIETKKKKNSGLIPGSDKKKFYL